MSGILAAISGAGGGFGFNLVISSTAVDVHIKNLAIAAGWDQVAPLRAVVTIDSGVYVCASSTSTYALQTGSTFPTGSTIDLINNGYILGRGGNGGVGGRNAHGTAGTAGGPAFLAQYAIRITNNGVIGGGGGGAGGGGSHVRSVVGAGKTPPTYNAFGAGGGGGGGRSNAYVYSTGGAGSGPAYGTTDGVTTSTAGASAVGGTGTHSAAGFGGGYSAISYNTLVVYGGNGGLGGDWGAAGSAGADGSSAAVGTLIAVYTPGTGGAAGAAVQGNSNITWLATGSRYGAIS